MPDTLSWAILPVVYSVLLCLYLLILSPLPKTHGVSSIFVPVSAVFAT